MISIWIKGGITPFVVMLEFLVKSSSYSICLVGEIKNYLQQQKHSIFWGSDDTSSKYNDNATAATSTLISIMGGKLNNPYCRYVLRRAEYWGASPITFYQHGLNVNNGRKVDKYDQKILSYLQMYHTQKTSIFNLVRVDRKVITTVNCYVETWCVFVTVYLVNKLSVEVLLS